MTYNQSYAKTVTSRYKEAYKRNLLNTLDFIEYAKRINGFYSLGIVKRLKKLLK